MPRALGWEEVAGVTSATRHYSGIKRLFILAARVNRTVDKNDLAAVVAYLRQIKYTRIDKCLNIR